MKIFSLLTAVILLIAGCRPSDKISQVVGVGKAPTLENTRWTLTELNTQPVSIETKPYLVFAAKSMVLNGFGGCNQLAGSYESSGHKIKFNNIAATRMFCQETMQVEAAFLQGLQSISHYRIEGHELILLQDNTVVARLRAVN
ncbi:MAG: META domain-containing protein [Cyclobacteriaceae bacterium]|nr:META domain-containing protein [Cyclobacteriaceae bacterium]